MIQTRDGFLIGVVLLLALVCSKEVNAQPTCVISQITDSIGLGYPLVFPSISKNGNAIVFVSQRDLIGSNADGNEEIFLAYAGKIRLYGNSRG